MLLKVPNEEELHPTNRKAIPPSEWPERIYEEYKQKKIRGLSPPTFRL